MSSKHNDCKIEVSIENLIKETESAGNRTRWVTIALILATVLICIGFYNSTDGSFANERLKSLKDFENIPVNNETKDKPLLDSYFGKNDFKDTKFKVGLIDFNQEEKFDGLKRLLCVQTYANSNGEKNPDPIMVSRVRKYLQDSFNSKTKSLVDIECESPEVNNTFIFKDENNFKYLKGDLNRILYDTYLYDENRFDKKRFTKPELITLITSWTSKSDKSSESALESERKTVDIVRLNRLLLEETFPGEILPSADIIPPSDSLKAKELAKYIAFDERVQFIEIPFFDSSIDVNDLGAFGGIGLIIILLLLRFSLSREIKNLNLSFRQSFFQGKLDQFYHLLAMRQVLTIPEMAGETKNQMLSAGTKWVYLLPFVVILLGVGYDYYSIFHYHVYEPNFVLTHLIVETLCVLGVLYLSLRCMERQVHIDEIWEEYNQILNYYKENQPKLKESKTTDENTKSETPSSKFCREIKEFPTKLQDIASEYKKGLYSLKAKNPKEEKEVIDIINKRFTEESASDGIWFVNLFFNRKNISRLIPISWVAEKVSESKSQLWLFLFIGTFLVSVTTFLFSRSLVQQFLVSKEVTKFFSMASELLARIGNFIIAYGDIAFIIIGFVGSVIIYINLDKNKRKEKKKINESEEQNSEPKIEPIKDSKNLEVDNKKKKLTTNSTKKKPALSTQKGNDQKNSKSVKKEKKSDGEESKND